MAYESTLTGRAISIMNGMIEITTDLTDSQFKGVKIWDQVPR